MKRIFVVLFGSASLAACASGGGARPDPVTGAPAGSQSESVLQALQRETEDQSRRIAELEARLALLENESRRVRAQDAGKPAETVRIGERRRADEPPPPAPPARSTAVIRLHESAGEPASGGPPVLPAPPPGVPQKLGVVPLPHERAGKVLAGAGRAAQPADAAARETYRTALRTLRERRWEDARAQFDHFLRTHPDHPLAANATYWRGEALYALRRYDEALIDFGWVVARFGRGDKAADALLKVALCQRHLGDHAAAERSFRQLREQYPSSDAARIASRENPS